MGTSDVENERLLGLHSESKEDPIDDEEANTPAWKKRLRRRAPAWLNWKAALIAVIILLVSAGLLTNSFRIVKEDSRKTIRPIEPVIAQPVEEQPVTEQPPQDPGATDADMHLMPEICQGTEHYFEDQIMPLSFDGNRSVAFYQRMSRRSGSFRVHVDGAVLVQKISGIGQPALVLKLVTNEPNLHLEVLADEGQQAMELTVPDNFDSSVGGQRPCLAVQATIWVPENAEINELNVDVVELNVHLGDTSSLNVTGYTNLKSVSGSIYSIHPEAEEISGPPVLALNSRRIEVNTVSGNIGGQWPLYDLLGMHTDSGGIDISIIPKEELAEDPKPAVLSLSTTSGAISAFEPISRLDSIPLRKYLVDVKSTGSIIRAGIAFSSGILQTISGRLDLKLLPVMNQTELSPAQPAQLETSTVSANTMVRILEPAWFNSNASGAGSQPRPFNCLEAAHKTTSGNVKLLYPESWEGLLHVHSTTGKPRVKGKNMTIVRQTDGWFGGDIQYRKGPATQGSTTSLDYVSGHAAVTIGEED